MIATLVALTTLIQTPQADDESAKSAAALIGKVLARYYKATRLSGRILLTTTAGKEGGRLLTTIQFDDPSKLYIEQVLQAQETKTWRVVSDGNRFIYPVPETQLGSETGKILMEPVARDGEVQTFRDIYAITAASLKDRSGPIDIAMGRYEDLKRFRGHLANYKMAAPQQIRGTLCSVVVGQWRARPGLPAESEYKLMATPQGDLMQYELLDHIVDPTTKGLIDIHQVWEVDLNRDGPTREELYRIP